MEGFRDGDVGGVGEEGGWLVVDVFNHYCHCGACWVLDGGVGMVRSRSGVGWCSNS